MSWFSFFVLALAVWRISNMLVNEDGPWMIFEHLRLRVGLQPPLALDFMRETDPPGQMPGSLFACVWCMSLWVAGIFVVVHLLFAPLAFWLAMPFALSAVSCMLDRWGNK